MTAKSTARRLSPVALLAPCGMNCALCGAFLRSRNKCSGCSGDDHGKAMTVMTCRIKNCTERRREHRDFCSQCASFPCERLNHLDKRYRAKYGMSMIENLRRIKTEGLRSFVQSEKTRWACRGCGKTLCVHQAACPVCGRKWR
jgi:hypothetical protein